MPSLSRALVLLFIAKDGENSGVKHSQLTIVHAYPAAFLEVGKAPRQRRSRDPQELSEFVLGDFEILIFFRKCEEAPADPCPHGQR